MSDSQPVRDDASSISDDNVARLIATSYRPETPDAEFVARVKRQLLAAARVEAARTSSSVRGGGTDELPLALRGWQIFAGWGLAIAVLIAVILTANFRPPQKASPFYRDGDVAWIDGKPFVARGSDKTSLPGRDLRPLDATLTNFEQKRLRYDSAGALVARERPQPAKLPAAVVGDVLVTRAGEKRRVALPDGSVLYVNEKTELKLASPSRVDLTRGELFVEVAPRDDSTFVVKTPDRQVTALGTKFAVRTRENESRVLVTQGKVKITGADAPVSAGEQFVDADGVTIIEAAPRADHQLDWMQEIIDLAEGALIPANDKAGGALIAVDPDGQDAKLSLRKYHVDVHIEDGFARTTIDQTYFNHMHSRLEGTFYFPLPPDASLSRLAMYVGGKLMEGGMAERDYARQVFETIKTRQLDPALLEWVDGSTFKMRVFPLEPRQEKRIILSYTQKLDVSYGRMKYRFPAGHNMKVAGDWSAHLRVKDGGRLLWNSPSHELNAAKKDGDLILTAQSKLDRLDRDLVLYLNDDSIAAADVGRISNPSNSSVGRISNPSRTGSKPVLLSRTTHENAHYLMLRWRPDLPTQPTRERRHWIFLFECSADRNPLLARTQIEIIRTILNHAEHDDTFSIATAGPYTREFSDQPLAASHENIEQAIDFLDHTHLVGALDLGNAFESLKPLTEAADNSVIVHVGSGVPVLGEREANRLVQMLPDNAKYVGVGVGKRFNRSLMKQAAALTGGYFTQINPDESTSWRGFELVSTLNAPRLLDVKIETDSGACQMLAMQDSLADGEELCAIGRYENAQDAPTELAITGQLDGQPFSERVAVGTLARSASEGSPLPRIWAKQQIELLTALGAEEHKDRIIALSKAMYVMSPFTSLLVLENEEMYQQYKIDRGRKDHWALYPAPERIEVVEERSAVSDQRSEEVHSEELLADDGTSSKCNKPSVEDVLNTILVHRPPQMLFMPDGGYYRSRTLTALQALGGAYAVPDMTTVRTKVTAADGGTVLIGGRRFDTSGVPVLTKLPYINRLYSNSIGGRDAQSLMIMVTPRIIIQQEEEARLGLGRYGLWTTELLALHDRRVRDTTWDMQTPFVTSVIPIIDYTGSMGDGNLDPWRMPNGAMFFEHYNRPRGLGYGPADADFDSLIDLITATVRPTTWEEVGGPGAIEQFPGNLSLVISQTQEISDAENPYMAFIPSAPTVRLWNGQTAFVMDDYRSIRIDETARFNSLMDERRYREGLGGEFDLAFSSDSFTARVPQFGGFDMPLQPKHRIPPWDIESNARRYSVRVAPHNTAALEYGHLQDRINELFPNSSIQLFPKGDTLIVGGHAKNSTEAAQIVAIIGGEEMARMDGILGRGSSINLGPAKQPNLQVFGADSNFNLGAAARPFLAHSDLPAAKLINLLEVPGEQNENLVRIIRSQRHHSRTRLVQYVMGRVSGTVGDRDCLYHRPQFTGNEEVFRKLISYAPGMNTTWADVQAVVEAEADVPAPLRGKVDEGARRLIEKARGLGWQTVQWQDDDGKTVFSLAVNGQGQFRYERRTRHGLSETVICDGRSLRHHYSEIGLGAKRELTRFHRAEMASLVPWAVLPAGDLAIGADVRLVNAKTISIVPLEAEGLSDYVELQMTFADDGRLAERRFVSRPDNDVLLRVAYARNGTVRFLDGDGQELGKLELKVKPAKTPQLSPDESQLVVLPMPARTRGHALGTADADFGDGLKFTDMREEDALRVVAANMHSDGSGELTRVVGQRFFSRGDRRLGFYTLMLAAGNDWNPSSPVDIGRDRMLLCDPLRDHPDSPLAAYIVAHLQSEADGNDAGWPKIDGPPGGFLQQLAEFRRLYTRKWKDQDPFGGGDGDGDVDEQDVADAIALVKRLHSPELRWAMLNRLQTHTQDGDASRHYADAYERLQNDPVLGYLARYEHARALCGVGDFAAARRIFTTWYEESLAAGVLPRIDSDFRRAFVYGLEGSDPFDGSAGGWANLMRETAGKLADEGRRPTVLTLAWQCHQLGHDELGNELLAMALAGVENDARFAVSLAGIEYLAATGQQARALALLEPLLADEETAKMSSLWRLGATLAQQQAMTARSAKMLEQALLLEYGALQADDVVNLEQLRSDYGELLNRYGQLATALASLEEKPSPELLARLVGAADRWRAMEDDVTQPCHQVARIFSTLGADALAWQYVTTPLAARPNEASPWLELAAAMKGESNYAMADRAYREAFRSEGSNAQILWDHAQMLSELGRYEEARKLYQQIAAGDWQPRFGHLQQEAKQIVGQ